ncbi:hypothetical protein VSX61_01995 [Brenneria populi subsp. brevivirga]|uniref:hypothetical protein n=1 Tax=Brenneria populi TaxID=1505588 RepID=UPI002E177375|nr:hypothetical protein [Brenneria populi subsp. brevivirga]
MNREQTLFRVVVLQVLLRIVVAPIVDLSLRVVKSIALVSSLGFFALTKTGAPLV